MQTKPKPFKRPKRKILLDPEKKFREPSMREVLDEHKKKCILRHFSRFAAESVRDYKENETVTEHLWDHALASALQQECPCCGRFAIGLKVWRMDTAYEEESSNWIFCCEDCFLEVQERWAEQWADYYSMIM